MPNKSFSSEDLESLYKSDSYRFLNLYERTSYALVRKTPSGLDEAIQFPIKTEQTSLRNAYLQISCAGLQVLHNFDSNTNKLTETKILHAITKCGEKMHGPNAGTITVYENGVEAKYDIYQLLRESDIDFKTIANQKNSPLFGPEVPLDIEKKFSNMNIKHKYFSWEIDKASIPIRKSMKRDPSQNAVMGSSAHGEIDEFYEKHKRYIHKSRRKIFALNRAAKDINSALPSIKQFRGEWWHLIGFSLSPMNINPQNQDNLAAGPAWGNSEMIAYGERTASWVANNIPKSKVYGNVWFETIPGTQIIERGQMQFSFSMPQIKVSLEKNISPWIPEPIMPQAKDLALNTLAVFSLLMKRPYRAIPLLSSKVPRPIFNQYRRAFNTVAGFHEKMSFENKKAKLIY